MKIVVKEIKEKTVALEEVSEDNIYAFIDDDDDIIKFHKVDSRWTAINLISSTSGYTDIISDTLHGCIERVSAENDSSVKEFDTEKEFKDWLKKQL